MLNVAGVALIGILSGGALGIVLGFSVASHRDVLSGIRPNTRNRLILFLARPTSEMRGFETVLFLILMLLWLVVFFGLCALPAVAAGRFEGDGPPLFLVAYGFAVGAWWLGQRIGIQAWSNML
jgi:hypothetical protein